MNDRTPPPRTEPAPGQHRRSLDARLQDFVAQEWAKHNYTIRFCNATGLIVLQPGVRIEMPGVFAVPDETAKPNTDPGPA